MFIGNLLGQWQETMFNKKQSDSVFLLFIFLGTIRWNKLLCVFFGLSTNDDAFFTWLFI